jgi:hypothetical protein
MTVTIGEDKYLTNFIRTGKVEGASAAPVKYDTYWLRVAITTVEEVEITRKYIDFCTIKYRDDLSVCYQEIADPKIFETEGISAWLDWNFPIVNDCPIGMLKLKTAPGIDPEFLVTRFRAPLTLEWVRQQRDRLFSLQAKEKQTTAAAVTNRNSAAKRPADSDSNANGNGNGPRRSRASFRQYGGFYNDPPQQWTVQNSPYWLQHPLMQPPMAQQAMAQRPYAQPVAQVQQPAQQANALQHFPGQHPVKQQLQQQQQPYPQGNQGLHGAYYPQQQ